MRYVDWDFVDLRKSKAMRCLFPLLLNDTTYWQPIFEETTIQQDVGQI